MTPVQISLVVVVCFCLLFFLEMGLERRKLKKRLDQDPDENIDIGPKLSPFEKYDLFEEKRRSKKMMQKYELPTLRSAIRKSIIYIVTFIIYKQYSGHLNSEHLSEIVLISLSMILFYIIMHYMFFIPAYNKLFDESLSGDIKFFSYDVDVRSTVRSALSATSEYAHPEFAKICQKVAHLNNYGFSIEHAIQRVMVNVKNERLLMFFLVLRLHDRSGGKIGFVLKELANLYSMQYMLLVRVRKATFVPRIVFIVSLLFLPLAFLFMYYAHNHVWELMFKDPLGLILFRSMIGLYVVGNGVIYYFLNVERL